MGGPRLEVELGDDPRVALVHVDRPGVHLGMGRRVVDRAQHAPGPRLDDRDDVARPPQRDVLGGPVLAGPEPSRRAAAQDAARDEHVEQPPRVGPEHREVGLAQGQLGGRGGEVRCEHVGVVGVHDAGLDRRPNTASGWRTR